MSAQSVSRPSSLRLAGRRVVLRPLRPEDHDPWREVRLSNDDWLLPWEPLRSPGAVDVVNDRNAFSSRCVSRARDAELGIGFGFGLFVDSAFAGEINLNSIQRGPFQNAYVGYWIDRRRAGHAYVPEALALVLRFAFEDLGLHRVQISIIPRNTNSRRVVEKLGIRDEGIAERYLEINGVWEDHVRYAITTEEWSSRRDELLKAWVL